MVRKEFASLSKPVKLLIIEKVIALYNEVSPFNGSEISITLVSDRLGISRLVVRDILQLPEAAPTKYARRDVSYAEKLSVRDFKKLPEESRSSISGAFVSLVIAHLKKGMTVSKSEALACEDLKLCIGLSRLIGKNLDQYRKMMYRRVSNASN